MEKESYCSFCFFLLQISFPFQAEEKDNIFNLVHLKAIFIITICPIVLLNCLELEYQYLLSLSWDLFFSYTLQWGLCVIV